MFYIAIEELNRLELKYISIAIGKDVLIIYNYHVRKFNYRSDMIDFITIKLYLDLIYLSLNFEKYIAKA